MGGFMDDIKNAFRKTENSLHQLILINLIVFAIILITNVVFHFSQKIDVFSLGLSYITLPAHFLEFFYKPWTLFTYFFVHQDPFHILFNLLVLYWFGQIIIEFLGSKRLTALYILGGLAGGILYLVTYNTIPLLKSHATASHLLGASAGVYAVVVAAATLVPNYTMFLMLFGPVKIKYIALFYVVISIAQTTGTNAGGNLAHLGGALIGFLFISQLRAGNDWGKPINRVLGWTGGLFNRKNTLKVSYRNMGAAKPRVKYTDAPGQDEIDTILDKISQSGYESLSKEEKQKLFTASQNN